MGEHGILMKDEMVRAILDGRKTVTRRASDQWAKRKVGDLLWMRECHAIATGHMYDGRAAVQYRSDSSVRAVDDERSNSADRSLSLSGNWRPGIHMPRWASRLTLRVTDIRSERCRPTLDRVWYRSVVGVMVYLGDSHGHPGWSDLPHPNAPLPHVDDAEARREGVADRAAYLALWERINGDVYPTWVWRIAFEVVRG